MSEEITNRTRVYRQTVKQSLKQCLDDAENKGQLADSETAHKAELLLALTLGFNIAVRGGASKREQNSLLNAVNVQVNSWRSSK